MLYGKVDYIVTDSPILLAGIYQDYRSQGKDKYVSAAAQAFMAHAEENGVTYKNFFLRRNKPFDPRGRYETENQAKEVDAYVYNYLCDYSAFHPITISGPDERRDTEILSYLGDLNFKEPPSL